MKLDLSVIILSYNTKEITKDCILKLLRNLRKNKVSFEVIIVDNASIDGSVEMLNEFRAKEDVIKIILNKKNMGFAKANNSALKKAQGEYILYLNSDVMVDRVDFKELITYLGSEENRAGLTVNVVLKNGNIDPASHRGFPTIWNAFCYLSGLEGLTRNIRWLNTIFGGYHLISLDLNKIHQIDSPSGAFFLVKKKVLDEVVGFDEDFFFYGEDIDLAYRIKKRNYKILYYPFFKVIHLKYSSGLKKNDDSTRNKTRQYFYEAMKIFYKKHYSASNPTLLNKIIYRSIDFLMKNND